MAYITKERLKSAEAGSVSDIMLLAECYYKGIETAVDYFEAMRLSERAYDMGIAEAAYNLACCLAAINDRADTPSDVAKINTSRIRILVDVAKDAGVGDAVFCSGFEDGALENELMYMGVIGKIDTKKSGSGMFSSMLEKLRNSKKS